MSDFVKVQGIVSARTGEPLVQFRATVDGELVHGWQQSVDEAREHARLVVESAANATYEAAILQFMREEMKGSTEDAYAFIGAMRIWRADKWGQPAPEDWRP
jgi:hypothetical protein